MSVLGKKRVESEDNKVINEAAAAAAATAPHHIYLCNNAAYICSSLSCTFS